MSEQHLQCRCLPAVDEQSGAGRGHEPVGTLREILLGPSPSGDGRLNIGGALRAAMATCGYESVKELQKAELQVRTGTVR